MCELLGRNVELEDPRAIYRRGWGPDALSAVRVIASWTLSIQGMNRQPTLLNFDVIDENYPITIGMDLELCDDW